MAAQVARSTLRYAALTVTRAPAVWGVGTKPDGSNPLAEFERLISAYLSNQFEFALFFHAACLLAILLRGSERAFLFLAWLLIVGGLLHRAVQILNRNVRLGRLVFTSNYLAVLGLWAVLLLSAHPRPTP